MQMILKKEKVKWYRKAYNEKHMTISIDGKTAFDEIQQPFLIKNKKSSILRIDDVLT